MDRPTIDQSFQNALQHQQAGRLPQAEQLYRQILAQQPNYTPALHFLGLIAHQVGRYDAAAELIRRAIALNPSDAAPHSNLGRVLLDMGKPDEAIAECRAAIALNPQLPEAHYNLGSALQAKGQLEEAIAAYRRAIFLNPKLVEAYNNLGNALKDKGQLDEAIATLRQAISLNQNYAQAHTNLGIALRAAGQIDQAITAHRKAIILKPSLPDAHYNLGNALDDKRQLDEAIVAYRQAIAVSPSYAKAHWNLALALLVQGEFSQGWDEYEWRWKYEDFTSPARNFRQPLWDGRPLAGATILLHGEQGFGDTLQFIRYLPTAHQCGGKIIIECRPELQRLLQPMAGDCPIISQGQPLPAFDVHCPLMSLPRVFATTLETIPRKVPYLHADGAMVENWRRRMSGDDRPLKVGLAWAGSRLHKHDRNRSMALSVLAPLGELQGVRFHSLQKGEASDHPRNEPAGLELIDWTEELNDFADTAALIANLDLVISVDTAVVHLAGAMGKPVWVMLPFIPDWRWLLEREDSPWYPTMRLFRQPVLGDWESVVRQVAEALEALCYSPNAS